MIFALQNQWQILRILATQISAHIEVHHPCEPKFVKVAERLERIAHFQLEYWGAKSEMTSSRVTIKQSTTDRKPQQYVPAM